MLNKWWAKRYQGNERYEKLLNDGSEQKGWFSIVVGFVPHVQRYSCSDILSKCSWSVVWFEVLMLFENGDIDNLEMRGELVSWFSIMYRKAQQ